MIDIHASAIYRIYMIGFLPGFTYLGGLDQRIATPAGSSRARRFPIGTIMIGGEQAGIAPMDMPSGWHNLGLTPVRALCAGARSGFPLRRRRRDRLRAHRRLALGCAGEGGAAGEPVAEEVRP